jgi:hypothetical protein
MLTVHSPGERLDQLSEILNSLVGIIALFKTHGSTDATITDLEYQVLNVH